jgi:hypothetical protein
MRARIADHKRGLNGMTVRGFPTQSATGSLCSSSARNCCGMKVRSRLQ